IGGHVAALGRGKGRDGVMQRLARSGIEANVFGPEAFELRQQVDQVFGQPVGVAAALGGDGNDGFSSGGAGAERILVGVDHHAFVDQMAGGVGQHGLGDDAQRERCGRGGGHSQERTARCGENGTFRHESPLAGYLTAEYAGGRAICGGWRSGLRGTPFTGFGGTRQIAVSAIAFLWYASILDFPPWKPSLVVTPGGPMKRPFVALMICLAFALVVFLPTIRPVEAGSGPQAAAPASARPENTVAAAAYCVSKGGEVDTRQPYYNTNAGEPDWFALSGERKFCKFTSKKDGSRIHVLLSTLYTDQPSLAALAYYAKVQMGTCQGNPASCYCSLLGGT